MKNLWKIHYKMKSLNYQIIFKETASVNDTLMIRSDQSFLNKIWNFTVFCDSSEWLIACMAEAQWLLNKTAALVVFNFNENDVNFFNFFTATVNLHIFVFNKNYSDLKFIFYLLLHFFYIFLSLCIIYFHEYIYHSPSHFFHQKLFRFLLFLLYK